MLPDSTQIVFASRFENSYLFERLRTNCICLMIRCAFANPQLKDPGYQCQCYCKCHMGFQNLIALGTLLGEWFCWSGNGRNNGDGELRWDYLIMKFMRSRVTWIEMYGWPIPMVTPGIAPNLPFRSFKHYPGLQGNLLCAQTSRGMFMVAPARFCTNWKRRFVWWDNLSTWMFRSNPKGKKKRRGAKNGKEQPQKRKDSFRFWRRRKPDYVKHPLKKNPASQKGCTRRK